MEGKMEASGSEIKPLHSLILDLPPSCIEFCPAHPDYLVVGTYNLQRQERAEQAIDAVDTVKPQSRNGSLVVFRLDKDANELHHVHTISYPSALLDLHFHPAPDKNDVLATVSSTGTLSFFRLACSDTKTASLVHVATHRPLGDDESVLFLSCAWHSSIHNLLAITTSDCEVHIVKVDDSWGAHQTTSTPVIAHTLEAWTVSFSPFLVDPPINTSDDAISTTSKGFTIFSGGDDSQLLSATCYSQADRSDDEDEIQVQELMFPAKGHGAGVTAILPVSLALSNDSSIVITGSYDDCLRVYSFPARVGGMMPYPPKQLAESNLGGGVWRLKLLHLDQPRKDVDKASPDSWTILILASCMHAGSRIVEIVGNGDGECQIKVLARFEEHRSMNYGSDWQPGTGVAFKPLRVVSTSFYDKLMCLWEF
ncbi:WD40-repeat-containing domain protein [Xylariaceae sp. FL1272]|nr:WD40-repeat-containing domain protein [Xylariaceae sp. FL1272]